MIERILKHCGLRQAAPSAAPRDGRLHDLDGDSDSQQASADEPRELVYVNMDTPQQSHAAIEVRYNCAPTVGSFRGRQLFHAACHYGA